VNDKPKVFISHASQEDDLSKRVRNELAVRLAAKFEVQLDAVRLQGGDPWRNELWTWWSECDLAIVVCSQAALQSDWVKLEVSILMRRRALNPNFPVLPLIIAPVTFNDVKNSMFGDQQLTEVQAVFIDATNVAQQLDEVQERLKPFQVLDRRNKPLAEWEDHLATLLEDAKSAEVLRDVATRLGATAQTWIGIPLQARIVARAMLEETRRDVFLDAIRPLRPRLMDRVKDVVDYVVPWWIPAEDVAPLSDVVTQPRDRRGIALATSYVDFAQWCIQRAACRYPPRKAIVVVAPKGGTSDEIADVIVEGVNELLDLSVGAGPAILEQLMKQREDDRDPIFAIVPISTKPNPKGALQAELLAEVIEKVNAQMQGVAFFVLAGQPAIEVETRTQGIVRLIPHDVDKETSLGVDYSKARTG
jgi:hypothetical protein